MMGRRRYALLYPAWILTCALLGFSLRNAPDPARKQDRILNNDAAGIAIRLLQRQDPARFLRYESVHVAWAAKGEGGTSNRWIVLCDRVPHSGLEGAVVVELDGKDGHLLVIRKPVGDWR